MKFDYFVIPFLVGMVILAAIVFYRFFIWIYLLPKHDKTKIWKGIFSTKIFTATKEVILESLVHRKLWKIKPLLGYMHSSLALGWFLLILFGAAEAKSISSGRFNPPYYPIFLKFFEHDKSHIPLAQFFTFIMDFLLLIILSGLILAIYKRFNAKKLGFQQTTKLNITDKFALVSLWLIFPLRLLAESFTAAIHGNGGFLTQNVGNALGYVFNADILMYPMWWMYSIVLAIFFVFIPFSRYMHIFAEVFFIYLKNFGVSIDKTHPIFAEMQLQTCSRCGVCIDVCQLNTDLQIRHIQSAYFLQQARNKKIQSEVMMNCLMCGRCENICPVSIDIMDIRTNKRQKQFSLKENSVFPIVMPNKNAKIGYFAGCMTHLTPTIKRAMHSIFIAAGENYLAIDENETICCGRPAMISGDADKAKKLIETNKTLVEQLGITTLITSCPICCKTFKEDYALNIPVLHHSEYIWGLLENRKIALKQQAKQYIYHDPCELGRGLGVYNAPRQVIQSIGILKSNIFSENDSLCCGGSLGNALISEKERATIAQNTLQKLAVTNTECLVTACPLCKKTFQRVAEGTVNDLAEIVAANLFDKPTIRVESDKHVEINA